MLDLKQRLIAVVELRDVEILRNKGWIATSFVDADGGAMLSDHIGAIGPHLVGQLKQISRVEINSGAVRYPLHLIQ